MKDLFENWNRFEAACRGASRILLTADYDGTLTPIVRKPDDAALSSSMREKLADLARNPAFAVGVISGRELDELRSLVGLDGIYYVGNHGLEIEGHGLHYINPEAERTIPFIESLAFELEGATRDIEGIIIQNKHLSLSVHYRQVLPEQEELVADTVRRLTGPLVEHGDVRVFTGKKVWEVRPPVAWDKGKALLTIKRELEKALQGGSLLTVFLGDDITDEDAFRVLEPPEGWSIYVGPENPESAAQYRLNSPDEVGLFLVRLMGLK